jgi:hypothetical protein
MIPDLHHQIDPRNNNEKHKCREFTMVVDEVGWEATWFTTSWYFTVSTLYLHNGIRDMPRRLWNMVPKMTSLGKGCGALLACLLNGVPSLLEELSTVRRLKLIVLGPFSHPSTLELHAARVEWLKIRRSFLVFPRCSLRPRPRPRL